EDRLVLLLQDELELSLVLVQVVEVAHLRSVYPGEEGLHSAHSGHLQTGLDLRERLQHEGPLVEPRVRNLEIFQGNAAIAVDEEVEIEGARPLGRRGRAVAAEGRLDGEQRGEEILRL